MLDLTPLLELDPIFHPTHLGFDMQTHPVINSAAERRRAVVWALREAGDYLINYAEVARMGNGFMEQDDGNATIGGCTKLLRAEADRLESDAKKTGG